MVLEVRGQQRDCFTGWAGWRGNRCFISQSPAGALLAPSTGVFIVFYKGCVWPGSSPFNVTAHWGTGKEQAATWCEIKIGGVIWQWDTLWTARRSNHSILQETNPGYLLEGLILKLSSNTLATWCEEKTPWKRTWCWKRLRAGGGRGDRGWDGWMTSPTQCTWVWVNSRWLWRTGKPGMLQSMGSKKVGHNLVTEQLQLLHPHCII